MKVLIDENFPKCSILILEENDFQVIDSTFAVRV